MTEITQKIATESALTKATYNPPVFQIVFTDDTKGKTSGGVEANQLLTTQTGPS